MDNVPWNSTPLVGRSTEMAALLSAVDDVLTKAIAFPPALVVLTSATLVNAKLYIRLLVADEDGAKTFDELQGGGADELPGGQLEPGRELKI